NLWDEIREKIFKNYALKSIDAVRAKLKQAILYIERNPKIVQFPLYCHITLMWKWYDGVFLQARMEDHGECMLVLIGATPEGKKELIGFQVGVRESAQSWRELLIDVKQRGLQIAPEIAVGDGALGFWK